MKLIQYFVNDTIKLGVKTTQGILDVEKAVETTGKSASTTLEALISEGEAGKRRLEDLVNTAEHPSFFLAEEDLEFAPVVTNPEKIVCVGLNYINHAKESKMEVPESPILFSKFNNTLAAHQERVPIPKGAEKIDYEAELVIVIGKTAKNVSKEEALSYVFGYSVGNDVSARDLQFKSGQWLLGKSPDGFAPVGPYLTTSDEVDPTNLNVECRVNGEVRQSANTQDMIFDCATIISYVSETMTLKPGDLIFSGTPDGVILGYPEDKQVWLKSGDEMVVAIDGLGELRNTLA